MNIPKSVFDFGMKHGLDAMATGGSMDYLYKQFPGTMVAIIASPLDAGSPETLNEDALVVVFLDEEWIDYISTPYKSTRLAIQALSRTEAMVDDVLVK